MKRLWVVPVVVAVFVLAGLGYWAFGKSLQINRSEMSRLAVTSTGIPSFNAKPYVHGVQQFASVPSKIVATEAAKDPGNTGIYAIGWKTPSDKGDADLLIEILPNASTAEIARQTLQHEYATKTDYKAAGLTFISKFAVPAIPGVFTSAFSATTKGEPTTYVDVILFRVGRVAVSTVVENAKQADLDQYSARFAVSEKNLLARVEPRFSMSSKVHRPLTALWWGLGALGLAALLVSIPSLIRYRVTRREHHEEHLRRRQQRHITARGGKVLKRRGVPAWQAGRHRAGQRARR